EYQRLPESGRSDDRRAARRWPSLIRQESCELSREGGRGVRYRLVSGCAGRLAHLVRRDGRNRRCRSSDSMAELRLRIGKGQACQGGVTDDALGERFIAEHSPAEKPLQL